MFLQNLCLTSSMFNQHILATKKKTPHVDCDDNEKQLEHYSSSQMQTNQGLNICCTETLILY